MFTLIKITVLQHTFFSLLNNGLFTRILNRLSMIVYERKKLKRLKLFKLEYN